MCWQDGWTLGLLLTNINYEDGLVWFLFYGPSTHFRSFWARSVNLATLFLGKPHRLGSLPILSAHSFASNWQLLFLNQRKRENGRRNAFMTKSPRKTVPDVGIELGAACMPSELASDRAAAPGTMRMEKWSLRAHKHYYVTKGISDRELQISPQRMAEPFGSWPCTFEGPVTNHKIGILRSIWNLVTRQDISWWRVWSPFSVYGIIALSFLCLWNSVLFIFFSYDTRILFLVCKILKSR